MAVSVTDMRSSLQFSVVTAILWSLVILFVIYVGYINRGAMYFNPEEGLGYYLGILGGTLMLLLLIYPLRKKSKRMRGWGEVRHWFKAHMVIGLVAPILILFHANFNIGSLNSQVALYSMLMVASSGLIGRYIYRKIHYGLYGSKKSLEDLRQSAAEQRSQIGRIFKAFPDVSERLRGYEEDLIRPTENLMASGLRLFLFGARLRMVHMDMKKRLAKHADVLAEKKSWDSRERKRRLASVYISLSNYFRLIINVAEYSFYERCFALWHILHMPLFLLMVMAGILHVVAVHMY